MQPKFLSLFFSSNLFSLLPNQTPETYGSLPNPNATSPHVSFVSTKFLTNVAICDSVATFFTSPLLLIRTQLCLNFFFVLNQQDQIGPQNQPIFSFSFFFISTEKDPTNPAFLSHVQLLPSFFSLSFPVLKFIHKTFLVK